jgi:hypothetical protein
VVRGREVAASRGLKCPLTLYASRHFVCGTTSFGASEARKTGTAMPPAAGPAGDPPDLREATESCGVSSPGKSAPFSHQHHALLTVSGDMFGATNLTCSDW